MRELNEEVFHACGEDADPVRLRSLIAQGAKVNWKHPTSGWTPLHNAAERGTEAVIRLLVEAGADVNALNSQGWTPLSLAVDSAIDTAHQTGKPLDLAVIRALLRAGADPRAGSSPENTALSIAERYGQGAVRAELMAHIQN